MAEADSDAITTNAGQQSKGLSPTVRALGVVSLFSDVSSEMVYPLNPGFITQVLGAPAWALGLIEGVAESTASLLKLYSGWLSDRIGRRKPFAVAGYALGAAGKPLIAVAGAWWHVLAARFVDRFGKGLRTSPRDALITENCAPEQRGRAFGFHRSMDTTGAVLGPLIGFLFLAWFARTHGANLPALHLYGAGGEGAQHPALLPPVFREMFRSLYWLAFIPGVLGVLVLAFYVRERTTPNAQRPTPNAQRPALPSWSSLSPAYRRYLGIVALFSLGNSSDTFLILRAQSRDFGVAVEQVFLLYALFNVVEAALAYPAGRLSDQVGRRPLVVTGYLVFALVYLGFAALRGPWAVWILFVIYGFYYTLTQGVQRALAADLSHPDRRATEIGAFHMVVGLAALPASIAAGWLYDLHPATPFFLGAACAALAALMMLVTRLDKPAANR
jgi:MFS family permease